MDIAFQVVRNEFNGRVSVQLEIKESARGGRAVTDSPLAKPLAELPAPSPARPPVRAFGIAPSRISSPIPNATRIAAPLPTSRRSNQRAVCLCGIVRAYR